MGEMVEKTEAQLRRRVHDEVNCLVTDPRLRGDAAIACEIIMEAAKTAIAAAVAAERARCERIADAVESEAYAHRGNEYDLGREHAARSIAAAIADYHAAPAIAEVDGNG